LNTQPPDTERAVATVQQLVGLKQQGLPIANSSAQLYAMIRYFRDPSAMRVTTTMHSGHERKPSCAALTTIQFMPNGDVVTCYGMPPVGNIKDEAIPLHLGRSTSMVAEWLLPRTPLF